MKRFLKKVFPLVLAAAIVMSIGWYLFEYDPGFTSDILLRQARRLEDKGNHSAAVWLYNLAYEQSGGDDEVAIELARQFKNIGNYSKAEYTLRNAIADGGSAELYTALSETYVEQGKLRDAVLMLDKLNADMKAQLHPLRPGTPTASIKSGSYNEYITVKISAPGARLYVSTDMDYPSTDDAYAGPITLNKGETTIFAVSVADNGLVSTLEVFQYVIGDVVEEVTFSDPSFEATVREQLDLNDNELIYSDLLWTVTELSLPADVKGITDLQWFPNLQTLTVEGAALDDAEAFTGLGALHTLSVTGSMVDNEIMQAIGTLTSLRNLTLTGCSISSIAPLSSLTNLTRLDLSNNAIRDTEALGGMSALMHLDLRSNALISLEGLSVLTQLEYLDVSYNSLVSTLPLASMTGLTHLNISSNSLRSLEGFDSLTNLQSFRGAYNYLLDLDALAQCQQLTYLDVSHNSLLNVDAAASLAALEELYFTYNEVSTLPAFSKGSALRLINGANNQISSLKNLSGLKNLTHIYMDYNEKLSSVSALAKCPALKEVSVYGTQVRDVSALTDKGILVVYTPLG